MTVDLAVLNPYSTLTDTTIYSKVSTATWNTKIINRGLHTKDYKQLKELASFYPKKIEDITAMKADYENYKIACTPEERTERIAQLNEKLTRLVDKYICSLKEIQFRELNTFVRQVS